MSLIEDELERLIDQMLIVVMSDGKKFRGKLNRFDSKIVILEDVYELSERNQWIRPVIYTSVTATITESRDVIEQTDRGYLNEVILNTRHILRIWPWEPKKLE